MKKVNGITDWKIEKVLELLKEHRVTLRNAAKLADVTYLEMMNLASKSGIDIGYSLNELKNM